MRQNHRRVWASENDCENKNAELSISEVFRSFVGRRSVKNTSCKPLHVRGNHVRFMHSSAYVYTIVYVSPTRCPRERPPDHFPFVFGEKIVGGRKTRSGQSISSVTGLGEDRVGDQRRGHLQVVMAYRITIYIYT